MSVFAHPVSPDHKPAWMTTQNRAVMVVPRRDGWSLVLQTQEFSASRFRIVCDDMLAQTGGRVSVQSRWAVGAADDKNAVLFCGTPDGALKLSRAPPDSKSWPPLRDVGQGLIHHYSQIAATSRPGQSVDAYFIDGDLALHTAFWGPQGAGHHPIPSDAGNLLLPTTALAACSPAQDTIVVAGVGYDLRLRVAFWKPRGSVYWTPPYAVGKDTDLLAAHTDLAVAWNKWTQKVEVLATSNDLNLCIYELAGGSPTGPWRPTSGTRSVLEFSPPSAATPFASLRIPLLGQAHALSPNPFGDLLLGFTSNGTRVVGCVMNMTQPAAAVSGRQSGSTLQLTRMAVSTSAAASRPPASPTWTLA